MREAGDPKPKKIESEESREGEYTPERLADLVFWSFLVSRGNPEFQREIFLALFALYPKGRSAMKNWGNVVGFRRRTPDEWGDEEKESFAAGDKVREERLGEGDRWEWEEEFRGLFFELHLDDIEKDETSAALLDRARRYYQGPRHTRIGVDENDELESGSENITIQQTLLDIFCDIARIEAGTSYYSSYWFDLDSVLYEFVKHEIKIDVSYSSKKSTTPQAQLMFCKFALSKNRFETRKFLPKEFQELYEHAGDFLRKHKDLFSQDDIDKVLELWKEKTGEDMVLGEG